jgi:hypothetical protein
MEWTPAQWGDRNTKSPNIKKSRKGNSQSNGDSSYKSDATNEKTLANQGCWNFSKDKLLWVDNMPLEAAVRQSNILCKPLYRVATWVLGIRVADSKKSIVSLTAHTKVENCDPTKLRLLSQVMLVRLNARTRIGIDA